MTRQDLIYRLSLIALELKWSDDTIWHIDQRVRLFDLAGIPEEERSLIWLEAMIDAWGYPFFLHKVSK